MRIRFDFELPGGSISLPTNYNYQVQSMIYTNISDRLSDFLHKQGFEFEKRQFKMFTFSKLSGRHRIKKISHNRSIITFYSSLYFFISSPFEPILQEFANRMVSGTTVTLNGSRLFISSVQVLMPPVFNKGITTIKVLSPITVRSTLLGPDGGHKTYYYSPMEKEFSDLIRKNILKKYYAFAGQYPQDTDFAINPLYFSQKRNYHVIVYKDFVVKGYSGIYELSGNRELKQFAYDCGIGERNSQGFGMFDIWNGKKGNDKPQGSTHNHVSAAEKREG